MTALAALDRFVPTTASDRRWILVRQGLFFFFAGLVVVGIFVFSLHPLEAYLHGASPTDGSLTHRLRNNSDRAGFFFIHIYTGNIALALGTLQVSPLWAAYPKLHRWLGRSYVLFVLIAVGTSYALSPRLSVYGTELGRQVGATLWGIFTILGVIAIRNADIERHRRWMMRSYAFAYMGITFMFLSALRSISGIPLEYGYPLVIHLSFVVNMTVCEFWLRRSRFEVGQPRRA